MAGNEMVGNEVAGNKGKAGENRRRRRKPLVMILVALVLLAGTGATVWFFFGGDSDGATVASPAVELVEPTEGAVQVSIEAPALIEPYRRLTVRATSAGRIVYRATAGSNVNAGEIIAELDPAELQVQVSRAGIDLEEAQINSERTKRTLDRAERDLADMVRLHQAGGASREQLENSRESVATAELAHRQASLAVQKAEINLRNARDDLAGATIRAPWDGVILSTDVDEGDVVGTNSTLAELADLSRVRVISEIDEFDVGRIAPGLAVNVRAEAVVGTGAGPFDSVVELVSPAAEVVSNISVFTVSAVLDNPGIVLKPGMSADLTIMISRDEGLLVPARAVTTVRNRSYVDIVPRGEDAPDETDESRTGDESQPDAEPETIRVEVGASDGVNTVILDGLEPTDRVVITSAVTPAFSLSSSAPAPSPGETNSIVPVSVPGTGSGGPGGAGGGGGGGGTPR
jgi:HlyD family secretion protein